MFRRKKRTQDPRVAEFMRSFFEQGVTSSARADPQLMARAYGLYTDAYAGAYGLSPLERLPMQRFHIGFVAPDGDLEHLTKRGVLIADTLLLSHSDRGDWTTLSEGSSRHGRPDAVRDAGGPMPTTWISQSHTTRMRCPDMSRLGTWITQTEELLKAGLLWYLPIISARQSSSVSVMGRESPRGVERELSLPNFVVRSGKVVAEFNTSPTISKVVRPILQIDLPFLDGVKLRDFSEVTVQEFSSHVQFRLFLREAFVSLDEALNADQAEREMIRIGHQIESEIWGVQAQMTAARRKRSVAVTGATVGTVGATLVAVYGPAFEAALTVLGAAGAGGAWGVIQAAADTSPQAVRDNKWYYVWALAKKSSTYDL